MKKIAFVIESLHCGGAEKSLVTLLQNFDFETYNVDLFLAVSNGDFQKFVPEKVIIKQISKNKISILQKLKQRLKFYSLRILNRLSKKYHSAQLFWKTKSTGIKKINKNYDIAIAYNQGFATYFVSEKIAAKKKFSWLNTDYIKAGYNIKYDFKYYSNFDKVVCVSKENEKSLHQALSSIKQKLSTVVIKDITDTTSVINKSTQSISEFDNTQSKNILTVGRLAQAKGLNLAIDACSILLKSNYNIKWYVIGEGPERKNLEQLIHNKNLQNHFILLGYKENPYPFIKSCDIYAQTSFFEGLGLTVIEAAILQKPIITTNFPTASTIIEHKKTGLICEMNAKAIASSIETYLKNPDLMNKVSDNLSKQKNNDKELSLSKINELLNI